MRWLGVRWPLVCLALLLLGAAGLPSSHADSGVIANGALPPAPRTGLAVNNDAEPGMGVAPTGELWATSTAIMDPRGPGQDIWKSVDGGKHWSWVAAPFNTPVHAIGGGDADLAVAPAPNSAGGYNVYSVSLDVVTGSPVAAIGDATLAWSKDDGKTWRIHPLAAEIPLDDRPWLTADGACRVHLTYHSGPAASTFVNTYDLCKPGADVQGLTLTPVASSRYAALAVPLATGAPGTYALAGFGKPVLARGRLVIPGADCPHLTAVGEVVRVRGGAGHCPPSTRMTVFVEVANPGATSWSLREVARSTTTDLPFLPAMAAVDGHGSIYVAWGDNTDSYLQRSDDLGLTWTTPMKLNPPGTGAMYATVAAYGDTVVVAWYQSDRHANTNDAIAMASASWSLQWAQAVDGGTRLQGVSTADRLIHRGGICTLGGACTIPGSRDLLDDFAVAVSPATGLATVVYTSDQPGGDYASDVTRFVSGLPG